MTGTPSLHLGACPAVILGSGVAFPDDPIDNPTLLARLAPDLPAHRREALLAHLADELGVTSRAHLGPGADPLTLAIEAARGALAEAGSEIVAILLATSTASRWTTAESARLANALGLVVAFCDLRSGCTGGLWALIEGARLARDAGGAVLVVGCDSFSRAFPAGERLLPFALGDGAGALVLAPPTDHSGYGLVRAVLGGVPALVDLATVTARLPPRTPAEPFVLAGDPEPFTKAAEAALLASISALAPPRSALIVPHVSRLATARALAAHTGLPFFAAGFTHHGNLGAASLLVALHRLRRERARGPAASELVLASAGGGLSYGAALWRLPAAPDEHRSESDETDSETFHETPGDANTVSPQSSRG